MDEAIRKELGRRYDLVALSRRIPAVEPTPVRGFDPGAIGLEPWRVSMRETLRASASRTARRVVIDAPEASTSRVLIEVVECTSAADALDALFEKLAGNQLARLPEMAGFGFAAFAHPAEAPPAIFFAHANLCISVQSFGPRATPVAPWAERVVEALPR